MIMQFQIKMARYGTMAIGMSTFEQLETKVLHATTYCIAVSTFIRIAKYITEMNKSKPTPPQ